MKRLMFLACCMGFSVSAWAVPISWSISTNGGEFSGSFVFDADVGGAAGYSSIDITESVFGDSHTGFALSGSDATQLFTSSDGFGDTLDIFFASPLTNAGGTVALSGSAACFSLCPGFDSYQFSGQVTSSDGSVSVPEPGTLSLAGLGLGLALLRRRRAAA